MERTAAAVKDMADPNAAAIHGISGEPHTVQAKIGDTFEVEMTMALDRDSMLELADSLEKTGNAEAVIEATRIRNLVGAPQLTKFQRVMNKNIKVKTVLLSIVAVAAGVSVNELIGYFMKRNGRRWVTIGNYSPKLASVSKITTTVKK